MLFFDRRKTGDRRSCDDRRKSGNGTQISAERRTGNDRRRSKDRRNGGDRRSGAYYSLPPEQREIADRVIRLLEKHIEIEQGETGEDKT